MNSMKKEKVSLFRFGVIFPLLQDNLPRGRQEQLVEEICAKEYEIPFSTRTEICRGTLLGWYYKYLNSGRDIRSLEPGYRKDKGSSRSLDDETQGELISRHRAEPDVPLTTIVRDMEEKGHAPINMDAVYRLINEWDSRNKDEVSRDMRRFEMESCNEMWSFDSLVLSSPKVTVERDGKQVQIKARCFAFIDDKSRLITHAQFYEGEKTEQLLDCMWKAMNKHGLPRRLLTDWGSAMRDARLQRGLAELEVQLIHCKPFSPQGKAKIERFWRTLRDQFVPFLPKEGLTLYEINRRLDEYIRSYNNRYHSGIGMSPAERYFTEVKAVRPAPSNLPSHFRTSVVRKVSMARTVQIENRLLEVPVGYAGKKIELRYFSIDEVEGFFEGESIGILHPVDLVANSLGHRYSPEGVKEDDHE